jgi:hypothetical protein
VYGKPHSFTAKVADGFALRYFKIFGHGWEQFSSERLNLG